MFINALMALQWTLMDDQGTINHKRLPNNFTLLDSLVSCLLNLFICPITIADRQQRVLYLPRCSRT